MYWVDPAKLATVFVLPLMVGHAGLVVAAWYVSAMLIRKGLQGALMFVGGLLALTLLVLVVGGMGRLSRATDYAGFPRGDGVSLFSVRLGWAFVISMLALFGSAIYVAIELGRDGRRVRAR
jgi:hypothetical protein